MAVQETTFVTLGQRALQWPLGVRMHYGHPDFFDKLWTCTRGGISKASKDTNLNEDIFAGFNHTLRGGRVQYAEYTQVGKGRDVGLMQITIFEKKLAQARRCPPRLWRALFRPGPPLPHLHRDWAHPSHICTGTGPAPPTFAPGLGPPLPHLHGDRPACSRTYGLHFRPTARALCCGPCSIPLAVSLRALL